MEIETNWQCGKSVTDRMLYMLNNELMCDVTIRAGPDKMPIKAHKYMLASSSPVFYSMFEGLLAEKETVTIPDIQPEIFFTLLKFVYSDYCEVNIDNLEGLMYASDKYMLDSLKSKCSKYLESAIKEENVFIILEVAQKFDFKKAVEQCLRIICESKKMLKSQEFAFLPQECVTRILKCKFLKSKEEIVYEGAIRWANERCKEKKIKSTDENVRNILGDLLFLIRFPKMDQAYFAKEISTKNILSKEEIIQVYQSYHGIPISTFCADVRLPEFIMFYRCLINQNRSPLWVHEDLPHLIEFKTKDDSFLKKVEYFAPKKFHGECKCELTIYQKTSTSSLCWMYKEVKMLTPCEVTDTTYTHELEVMVKIEKNVVYMVELEMPVGLNIYTGKGYRSKVTQDGNSVTFLNSSSGNEFTNINKGQIAGIGLAKMEI